MSAIGSKELLGGFRRIKGFVNETPILTCSTLNRMFDTNLYFKCENFQKVGAFKFRGAMNAVLSLEERCVDLSKGLATHSSGNHAAALAHASALRGYKAFIVMPRNAPETKQRAVKGYGAEIILCEPTLQAREETLAAVVREHGSQIVHPFNDYDVIIGQSTAFFETILYGLDKGVRFDKVLVPVGGGGFLSGTSLSAHFFSEGTQVIACEPSGADDAYQSFKNKRFIPSKDPKTIGDGLLTSLGDKTFEIMMEYVDDVCTVEEESIVEAMRLIWERMKIIVEPSSAVPLAAILEGKVHVKGKHIAIMVSGGNLDLTRLPWL